MKKRFKLLTTIASLCLSFSLMAFGVFAAAGATGSISSTITFQTDSDVFANVTIEIIADSDPGRGGDGWQNINDNKPESIFDKIVGPEGAGPVHYEETASATVFDGTLTPTEVGKDMVVGYSVRIHNLYGTDAGYTDLKTRPMLTLKITKMPELLTTGPHSSDISAVRGTSDRMTDDMTYVSDIHARDLVKDAEFEIAAKEVIVFEIWVRISTHATLNPTDFGFDFKLTSSNELE